MYILNLDKKDLRWLQTALNKKDCREWSKQILVKGGYALATNGHVLHKIKISLDEIEGTYNYQGIKIEDSKHPLDNKDLMSDYADPASLSIDSSDLNCLILDSEIGIDRTYFNNAIHGAKEITMLRKSNSIKISYDNREVLIMGIRRFTKPLHCTVQ